LPLIAVVAAMGLVFVFGLHRHLSIETLIVNHAYLHGYIVKYEAAAIAAFILLYMTVVALSIPGAVILTVTGGILFGAWIGGLATVVGATAGATLLFLIARSAAGEFLMRRVGTRAGKLAEGFRADAFSYLLFLRLVPLFPFFLVNLVPALCGVRLGTFVAATALGIIPATFTFAFVGAGLDSVIRAQGAAYHACHFAGRSDCRVDFDFKTAITPELITALVALGLLALIPVVVRRLRARSRVASPSG
jgi:uncharacterized membrane protein YdjX (TVP38/TMEM64 family)